MTYIEKLQAAGWIVRDGADHIMIRSGDAPPDAAFAKVAKNVDGSLHLVTSRSDFHRLLARIIAAEPAAVEGADYTPSLFGE